MNWETTRSGVLDAIFVTCCHIHVAKYWKRKKQKVKFGLLHSIRTEISGKEIIYREILPKPSGEMPGETMDNEHQIMTPEATAQFFGLHRFLAQEITQITWCL